MMGRTLRHRRSRNKQKVTTSVDDSKIFELLQWLGIRTQLKLFHFEDTGRGLRTVKKLVQGDILISVPLEKMITRKVVLKHYNYPKHWSTQLMLSCFLIEESSIWCSQWKIYLETLPKTYDVPYFDCPQILIPVLPRHLRQLIENQVELIEQQFQETKKYLKVSIETFSWAWFSVNTRGVYFKDGHDNIALAPYLDMFNHDCNVQVQADRTDKFYMLKLTSKNDCPKKHSQVFINYGPHDNVKLYLEYGFVVPNNFHDCVSLCLEDLLLIHSRSKQSADLCKQTADSGSTHGQQSLLLQQKIEFIQKQQLHSKLQLVPDEHQLVSWSVLACLHVLQNPKVDNLNQVFHQDLSIEHFKIDIENIVLEIMRKIQDVMLQQQTTFTKILPQVLNIQYSICQQILQMMQLKLSK